MPSKKSNIISLNLSDYNLFFLQRAGILNKHKRSTGRRSVSAFINECIKDYIKRLHPSHAAAVEETLLIHRLNELQKDRNALDDSIEEISKKLGKLRGKEA